MNTLSKVALGMIGQLRPRPVADPTADRIRLPPAQMHGGLPLLDALGLRRSSREFAGTELPLPLLSTLLWAAWGVNRDEGGRTVPSAINAQEVELYVAMPGGAYLYEPEAHALRRVTSTDVRRVTGYQDFVDSAPMDLVFVADHRRLLLVPEQQRIRYASACAGAIAQNIYLFAAANGLSTVIRAWMDRQALANALGLGHDHEVLLAQTVGYPLLS